MAKKPKSATPSDPFDIDHPPEPGDVSAEAPSAAAAVAALSPLMTGKTVFIRTVTYHAVGTIVAMTGHEIVLNPACWVADSGRWHEALKTGNLAEVEPFTDPVSIGRGAIVDATLWRHTVPKEAK